MKTTSCTLFLIFTIVQISYQRSTPDSDSYVAAVVEFSPTTPSGESPASVNAARYVSFIEEAAKQNADIIVFPEAGLTSVNMPKRDKLSAWATFVPPPASNYNPCNESTIPVIEAMTTISCAARENGIYVVINIDEKVHCANESCSSDGRLFYNTNVAFDREGKIIARYRKTNLFNEPNFNVTKIPEVVTFDTDFGVTFGTFICFDILFKTPALYLTRMRNVTDVVFPTAWFSEVPFLTAVQTQAGWAYAEDANFLVAGYNRPQESNAGSGIYLGRQGIARATMPDSPTSEMLIAEVPKKNRNPRTRPVYSYSDLEAATPTDEDEHWLHIHDEFRRKRDTKEEEEITTTAATSVEKKLKLWTNNFTAYETVQFNSSIEQTLCDGNFCCNFNIEVTNVDPSKNYHLVVFDGHRATQQLKIGVSVCAVVLCVNESVESCGAYKESDTIFNSISINVTYPNYENLLIMPSSLGEKYSPLLDWTYEDRYEEKKVHISATLGKPAKNLVACGIYTRDFDKDQLDKKSDSNTGMPWATLTALALVSVFLLFLYRKGWRKPWHRHNPHNSEGHGPYQHLRIR